MLITFINIINFIHKIGRKSGEKIFIYGGRKKKLRVGLLICLIGLAPGVALAQDFALSLYGASLTKEKWEDAFSYDSHYAASTIFVLAVSWTPYRFFDDDLSMEIEAQVGKYFGDQDHWEFNLPIIAFRWHRFPWSDTLDTTFAYGIGPSYATSIPEIEEEINDETSQWLIYWYGEFTFGPLTEDWEVFFRLHHRSDGFGTVNEDGGSNALGLGLRYRF